MRKQSRCVRVLQVSVCLLLFSHSEVRASVLTFDSLSDSDIVTTQFPGLIFSNAIVLSAGISLNEFESPPHSDFNVVSDNGGPITIVFTTQIQSFIGYLTYLTPLTLTAFDAGNNQVGQVFSAFGNNLALSGDLGSSPNELLQLAFAGGISSVTISGDSAGGSFVMDDVSTFATVPEPSSMCLFLASVAGLIIFRRRFL